MDGPLPIPLERTLSGVFHREDSRGTLLTHSQSTLDIAARREDASEHPDWATRGLALQRGALVSVARGFARGFALAYAAKFIEVTAFGLLGKGRKNPVELLKTALGPDSLRFGAFFGVWSALVRAVNYAMYSVRGVDDRLNAAIAGAVAGLAVLLDEPERRKGVSIFIMVRGVSVAIRALARARYLPYWKHAETAFFGLVNGPIMYAFLYDPSIMDPGYYRWILNMGAITDEGLHKTLRVRRDHFFSTGELLPFHSCQPHYHEGQCVSYCTYDWFLGLGRAFKIYLPVHVVPLLLFRSKHLAADPAKQLYELARGILLSCMFLSSYQYIVKQSQCLVRNAILRDEGYVAFGSGLLTAFACLFERPSRVSELMLYCVPKSLQVVWLFGRKHHPELVQDVPLFEVPLFVFGSAMLMSGLRQDLNSTYFNLLKFIVGAEHANTKPSKARKAKTGGEEDE